MQVIWFKRDLRLIDHQPLAQALARAAGLESLGPVLALYIHEPSLISQPDFSFQHSAFIRETLDEMRVSLQGLGTDLLECRGEVVEVLSRLHQSHPFTHLWAHQETGGLSSFERDKAVGAWCRQHGVCLTELEQNGVRRGAVYRAKGFDFDELVNHALEGGFFTPRPEMPFFREPLPDLGPLTAMPQLFGAGADKTDRVRGGASAAFERLEEFAGLKKVLAYPFSISSPNTAADGCSRLSPYLTYGILSERMIIWRIGCLVAEQQGKLDPGQEQRLKKAVQFFLERMYWRSAYLQNFERGVQTERFTDLDVFDGLREAFFDPARLTAWKEGRTGYPMVDAAMRMLRATGWINMRARGMLASFALNELWLAWREVGMHLAQEFLDYEPGIHWNQIQIHAGSSRQSRPLHYNAVKQAKDHDEQGVFVRKWVPELCRVPTQFIFEPWGMPFEVQSAAECMIGVDYPAPIVEHLQAARAARQIVYALRDGKISNQQAIDGYRHALADKTSSDGIAQEGQISTKNSSSKHPKTLAPPEQPSLF